MALVVLRGGLCQGQLAGIQAQPSPPNVCHVRGLARLHLGERHGQLEALEGGPVERLDGLEGILVSLQMHEGVASIRRQAGCGGDNTQT